MTKTILTKKKIQTQNKFIVDFKMQNLESRFQSQISEPKT